MSSSPMLPGLLECMHCGLCLESCPTYRVSADEADSPRGRLALMRAVDEKRLRPADVSGLLSRCLQCYSCETTCPSKVPYGSILQAHLDRHRTPARSWAWLRSRRRLRLAGSLLRAARNTGLLALMRKRAGRRFRRAAAMVPDRLQRFHPRAGAVFPAQGDCRGRVALHLGCVQSEFFGRDLEDCVAALPHQGFEVHCPPQPSCCGAVLAHDGDSKGGMDAAQRTLQQLAGFDAVLVPSAGCNAFLSMHGQGNAIHDPFLFLIERGLRGEARPLDLRVHYSAPCHRRNRMGDESALREGLSSLPGVELLPAEQDSPCCGAGGAAFLREPELSAEVGKQKLEKLPLGSMDVLISGNPGCAMQLELELRSAGSRVEVLHPITLLRRCLGA